MKSKAYNGEVRSSEKDFETLQLGAFATPGLLLAQEVVSQCHSEEWSDEESAFLVCSFGTPTPIRHEYGRKADPSLGLRMTRARFFGLRQFSLGEEEETE